MSMDSHGADRTISDNCGCMWLPPLVAAIGLLCLPFGCWYLLMVPQTSLAKVRGMVDRALPLGSPEGDVREWLMKNTRHRYIRIDSHKDGAKVFSGTISYSDGLGVKDIDISFTIDRDGVLVQKSVVESDRF